MTKLYACDNCGEHVDSPRRTLYKKTTTTPGMTIYDADNKYTAAYHICEDCWSELGWDE